jgi:hypothetical protein
MEDRNMEQSQYVVFKNEQLQKAFDVLVRLDSRCSNMMGACVGEFLFEQADFILNKPEDWIPIVNHASARAANERAFTFLYQDAYLVFLGSTFQSVLVRFQNIAKDYALMAVASEEFDNGYEALKVLAARRK